VDLRTVDYSCVAFHHADEDRVFECIATYFSGFPEKLRLYGIIIIDVLVDNRQSAKPLVVGRKIDRGVKPRKRRRLQDAPIEDRRVGAA